MKSSAFRQLAWVAIACFALPGSAQARPEEKRFPISVGDLALALQADGRAITDANIHLQMAIFASTPSPKLKIEASEAVGTNLRRFRFTCSRSNICLPFYALVDGGGAVAAEIRPGGLPLPREAMKQPESAPISLHAGEHVTLLLENHFMRISLPVVLIDTGRPGTEVRVASLDRKQVYRGQVYDDGSVHGNLQ